MKRKMSSHQRNYNADDLISELPNNIIDKILELMPIRDAARTSILSTKWRYKWTSLSQLVFDKEFFNHPNHPKQKKTIHAANIINEILLLRDSPLCKFSLCVPLFFDKHNIGRLIRFLSVDGVKEIILDNTFPLGKNPIKLPSNFFSCQDLTYLDLRNFIFEPPRVFRGFKHLTALDFRSVFIATAVFETLVSTAPRLERLTFIDCPGFDHVYFYATNLKYMQLCGDFKSISINHSPYLSVASIDLSKRANYYFGGFSIGLGKIFDNWPRLKKLVIGRYALSMKLFSAVDLPKSFPTRLDHLKHLHFDHTCFQDVNQFSSAFFLIRCSPNLQKLEISNPSFDSGAIQPIVNFINEKDYAECTLGKLRTVRMEILSGSVPELELLKYLLSSTPVLETMMVEISRIDPQAELILTRKLMQFRRVSPKAEVIYKDNRKRT